MLMWSTSTLTSLVLQISTSEEVFVSSVSLMCCCAKFVSVWTRSTGCRSAWSSWDWGRNQDEIILHCVCLFLCFCYLLGSKYRNIVSKTSSNSRENNSTKMEFLILVSAITEFSNERWVRSGVEVSGWLCCLHQAAGAARQGRETWWKQLTLLLSVVECGLACLGWYNGTLYFTIVLTLYWVKIMNGMAEKIYT